MIDTTPAKHMEVKVTLSIGIPMALMMTKSFRSNNHRSWHSSSCCFSKYHICIISSNKKQTHHFHPAIEGGLGGGLDWS
jgi:hypothetical protein